MHVGSKGQGVVETGGILELVRGIPVSDGILNMYRWYYENQSFSRVDTCEGHQGQSFFHCFGRRRPIKENTVLLMKKQMI